VYSKPDTYDRNKNGMLGDDEYYGILHGCHSVDVPGLILEHSYHTNLLSAQWLYQDANIKRLAVAEAEALRCYYYGKVADKPVEEVPVNSNVVSYKIVAGDTLGKIASRFRTTVQEIMALNPKITNPNIIRKNDVILVPTCVDLGMTVTTNDDVVYVVKFGDTLSGICSKYKVNYLKVASYNGIVNPSKIYPGQVIIIKRT
jgi:LysM repeat protein